MQKLWVIAEDTQTLEQHQLLHHQIVSVDIHIDSNLSKFTCKICVYIAKDTYTLRQYELFHHKIVSVDQEKIENRFFKCKFCPKDHQMVSVG